MIRGKCWLLPIPYTHFMYILVISIIITYKYIYYKNFTLRIEVGRYGPIKETADFSGKPTSFASYGPPFSNYVIKDILPDVQSREEHDAI